MFRYIATLLVVLSMAGPAMSDWPQFRGPDGQGQSTDRGLPVKWTPEANIVWQVPIPGKGWSSPVILDGQIWLTTALQDGKSLHAICVDEASGEIVHDVEVFAPTRPARLNAKNSYASPSPVVERGRVYVHFGTMGTACLSTQTGEVLWRNEELQIIHYEGPGSSPVLYDGLLIVNCDGMFLRYVAALDKQDGQIKWRTNRSAPQGWNPAFRKAYSTPLVIDAAGTTQLISTGAMQVNSYDPRSGTELWHVSYSGYSNVPRPVYDGKLVMVCTGFSNPELWAIRPDGEGDVTKSHVVWKFAKQVPKVSSPIIVDGRLYMVSDRGVASCLDAETGEALWTNRMGGNYSASPVHAEGHIYFSSEEGRVTVIEAGPRYVEAAVNQLDGQLMASPAISGRAMFFRTDTQLVRIE